MHDLASAISFEKYAPSTAAVNEHSYSCSYWSAVINPALPRNSESGIIPVPDFEMFTVHSGLLLRIGASPKMIPVLLGSGNVQPPKAVR